MSILLAGDIGGTKTILRLVDSESPEAAGTLPQQKTLHEETYASQDFSDLVPMVREFLATASGLGGGEFNPEKACFGIAGPVTENTSKLTNLNWILETSRLERELEIPQVQLINDFAAIGYGILGLSPRDKASLQEGKPQENAPIAVIGAGTGLGQAFLLPFPDGYRVFATEGGHADFAPRSALEFQLLEHIKKCDGRDRVSAERVISGQGIVAIYRFLRDRAPEDESPTLTEAFTQWNQENSQIDLAAKISQVALEKSDPLCTQAMQCFVRAYGAEAGNLALKLLPYSGLYITGGIAPKILPLLQQEDFVEAFCAKGRVRNLLESIPVRVVLNPKVGLIGAALYAAR
ncbi:glucokinase [Lusitaniella coriacea]|uniref:glucokinase n=1 Tax=Lusitaniella coriacea TaxID=1983105 RepID=UPI003CF6AA66